MLAKSARLTESADFARATKSGVRFSTQHFVGYLYPTTLDQPARAGLIIGKSVGGSVTRHRIARKLRHIIADSYQNLPHGTLLVIRALSGAQTTDAQSETVKIMNQLIKKLSEKADRS